ncbi:MAG: methionine ABC transporter ATP-binding protein [Tissierellia bacterium]|nr:methionine ABC transporter ATP-binding protein [Tissierellia bacterium]
MIEVKNLVKSYDLDGKTFKALNNVNFKVEEGEIYGIIGLSGAGKSTLVRCINRLEEADSGSIEIKGQKILDLNDKELSKLRKKTAMIFQSFNLFQQKTVYKNIAYPLELEGLPKAEIDKRVLELLDFVDLASKKNEYPTNLSGGQKQRVAIARALSVKPEILLSDEATSALDPANTKVILDLLKKAVKEFNLTIIMITHQMEVAKAICDRIAVMEAGKIIEENTVENLFKAPKHPITKSFVRDNADEIEKFDLNDIKKDNARIFVLNFDETKAKEAIVSKVIKERDVSVNILLGKISKIKDTAAGFLTVEIEGRQEEIDKAVQMFRSNGVIVEEIQ